MNIYNFLIKADKFCDYVPIVGTVTNLVDLFEKAVMKPTNPSSNNYKIHIMQKKHCAMLLIPVIGSIYVYFVNKKEQKGILAEEAVNACRKGNYDELEELFNKGLNPNAKVNGTPIIFNAVKNHELLTLFIEKGADVTVKNSAGQTVFYESISKGSQKAAIAVLNSNQIKNLNQNLGFGGPPLIWACERGWLDFVENMINRRADINIVNENSLVTYPSGSYYYRTPLLCAIRTGNVELVDLLIENHAEVGNKVSSQKIINPIQLACEKQPIDRPILGLLLDQIETHLEPALAKAALEAVCRQGDYHAFDLVWNKCRQEDLKENVESLRKILKWRKEQKPSGIEVDIEEKLNTLFSEDDSD